MPVIAKFPGYGWFHFLKNIPVRTGIYAGVCLSVIFSSWLFLANRVPLLEPFALERNMIGALLLALFSGVPLIRYYRSPENLLISGLLGWSILTLTYWLLSLKFVLLEESYSTFEVFVLGVLSYFIFATLSWLGTIIWRVRAEDHSHLPR